MKPIKTKIQTNSIDIELRNGLWNCLSICYWDQVDGRNWELKFEMSQAKTRLSKLIDLKLDAAIPDDMFNMKHNELNETIAKLKWQLRQAEVFNPDFYENGLRTLELSKSLYPEYLTRDSHGKAQILRTIASNYVINDVSVCPKWRKPFDLMAKGLSHSAKLPGGTATL